MDQISFAVTPPLHILFNLPPSNPSLYTITYLIISKKKATEFPGISAQIPGGKNQCGDFQSGFPARGSCWRRDPVRKTQVGLGSKSQSRDFHDPKSIVASGS